jgi:hypothetical protein
MLLLFYRFSLTITYVHIKYIDIKINTYGSHSKDYADVISVNPCMFTQCVILLRWTEQKKIMKIS